MWKSKCIIVHFHVLISPFLRQDISRKASLRNLRHLHIISEDVEYLIQRFDLTMAL